MKLLNILKKESAKVKGCYGKAAKRVIVFFRQLVYYDYNRVKFGEFKYVRERANKID
jgi:hypothetical protein